MNQRSTVRASSRITTNVAAIPKKYRAAIMGDTSMAVVGILFLCMATVGPANGTPYASAHAAIFGSIGLFAFAFGLVRLLKCAKTE